MQMFGGRMRMQMFGGRMQMFGGCMRMPDGCVQMRMFDCVMCILSYRPT